MPVGCGTVGMGATALVSARVFFFFFSCRGGGGGGGGVGDASVQTREIK